MYCSLPCSSVHGIFQARVLEWVAISFFRGSFQPRVPTQASHIVGCLSHQGNLQFIPSVLIMGKSVRWVVSIGNRPQPEDSCWPVWDMSQFLVAFGFCYDVMQGFPGGTSGKEYACQDRRHKRLGFNPWIGKIPWRKKWQPTPLFLPGESHRQRSLVGCRPFGCKELDMTERLNTHAWQSAPILCPSLVSGILGCHVTMSWGL